VRLLGGALVRPLLRAVAVMAFPILLFMLLPGCNSTAVETPLWIGAIILALLIGVAVGFRSARWYDAGFDPSGKELDL